ncbi:aminoacyl-tRNA hydrolase [Candidatus Dependentiae bacterium Noda2021]|nr:aminoacyl-tRNA hydrolase [Candidatus Dependentiae bacterium Noda2021]
MKHDVFVNDTITIPDHEIEISSSKSGGAGGQHVNKTETRITVRWNIVHSTALPPELKERVLEKLQSRLTADGDLIIHNSTSRSQDHNKKMALAQLGHIIKDALFVAKKRMKTRQPRAAKEARLKSKGHRGSIKKMRSKKIFDE